MLSERLMVTLPAEARSRTPDRMDSQEQFVQSWTSNDE
jgi:hypothetical protein